MYGLGRRLRLVMAFAVAGLALGCFSTGAEPAGDAPATPSDPVWFCDITVQAGLKFVHDATSPDPYFMPRSVGSGAALFDYDNDGRLDIYLLQNGGPDSQSTNRLFHQEPDGRFKDVSAGSGLDIAGHAMGVAIGDVNNDGLPDVLVTEYGRIRLFLNNGNGTFTDVSKAAGLESVHWGTSASFVDYDRDGWLDLVVVNYVDYSDRRCSNSGGARDFCAPKGFPYKASVLYHNLGRVAGSPDPADKRPVPVRFEDVTVKAGLDRQTGPGLGVVCADFDGDGWPDLFIANDGERNHLWINQRDGTFKEEALVRGIACNGLGQAEANMGIALGDVRGKGTFDLFVTHLSEENHTLWVQGPRGFFQDHTGTAGLTRPRWRGTGFGTVLADFDHDGALDLAIANGGVKRTTRALEAAAARDPFWGRYCERNQLFINDGQGHFRDISPANAPLCATPAIGRGLACGDLDNDGALDLLVTNVAGPVRLFRNVAPKRGHWLLVRAVDPGLGGRDAYGAEVTVRAGHRRWRRWLNPGSSYLCSNDPRAHFGLGPVERIDALEVLWPDGAAEVFPGRPADQLVVLRKGGGRPTGPR